jgi:hypothetical protein
MKPNIQFFLGACSVTLALSTCDNAFGQAPRSSVSVPVQDLNFYELGKEKITVAKGYGDPAIGAHSNYIKLPGGATSPRHTHSSDYYGVVITGVVTNEQNAVGPDHPLAPGSYWFQKGGEPHVTKCISATECLIFVTQASKFDFHVTP